MSRISVSPDINKILPINTHERANYINDKRGFYAPKDQNVLAITGFILSFLFPYGLVLSIFGLISSFKRNGQGRGWAIAGIVISGIVYIFYAWLIIYILFIY